MKKCIYEKPEITQKNPVLPKKTHKTQKNPGGLGFLKNPGFFSALVLPCF